MTAAPVREGITGLTVILVVSALALILYTGRSGVVRSIERATLRFEILMAEAAAAMPGGGVLARAAGSTVARLEAPGRTAVTIDLGASARAAEIADFDVRVDLRADRPAASAAAPLARFRVEDGRLLVLRLADARGELVARAPVAVLLRWFVGGTAGAATFATLLVLLVVAVRRSKRSEHGIRDIVQSSPTPLLVIDRAAGDVAFANEAVRELFGGSAGSPAADARAGLARNPSLARALRAFRPEDPRRFEVRLLAGDATERWAVVAAEAAVLDGRDSLIVGLSDVTERHLAEEAREAAKAAAEASDSAKSRFLAMISHELRTPINGIVGLADILGDLALPPRAQQIGARIRQASATLAAIVGDILDVTSLEAGAVRLDPQPFDLGEVVLGAVALASAAAAEKGLGVDVSAPPGTRVTGDPARVQQILVNLVGNAIKFTPTGRVKVSCRTATTPSGDIAVELEVADSGIGIDPAAGDRIFEAFTTAEPGDSVRFGGTGLGLTITRRLVEAMGGSIGYTSRRGQGTTFTVRFELPPGAAPACAGEAGPALSVLIADDVALNLDVTTEILAAAGHIVERAANGAEAVAKAAAGRHDVILMDVRMPDLDGVEATRRIRALNGAADRSVVGLSANVRPTDLPSYHLAGMDLVVAKPVDRLRLEAALVEVRARRIAHRDAVGGWEEPRRRIADLSAALSGPRFDRLLGAFRQVLEESAEEIGRCYALGRVAAVREAAHRLAGAAGNLRITPLAEAAARLEDHAADVDGGRLDPEPGIALGIQVERTRLFLATAIPAAANADQRLSM